MFDIFPGMLRALLRNGVLLGLGLSLISTVVYWKTITSFVTTPTVIGIASPTYLIRFLAGIGIGVGIFAAVLQGIGYALRLYANSLAGR